MKIHLLSDLHLEFWGRKHGYGLEPKSLVQPADVLVLAGDINVGRTNVKRTLRAFAPYYDLVLYTPGNHEYYGGLGINDFVLNDLPANVHMLNPGAYQHKDVTFIGATLWTDFGKDPMIELHANKAIADFARAKITTEEVKERNITHTKAIQTLYEAYPGKKVIFTHFSPAQECISKYWRAHGGSLNSYFHNDLGSYIETLSNTTWLFGHTHDSVDIMLGETRCFANPLGYPGEKKYEPKILEI